MPAHASNRDDLDQTKKDIEASRTKQEELAGQVRALENEQKNLQEKLVGSAKTVQKSEAELSSAEEKLRILNEQLQVKNTALKTHHKNLAALVQAALRLSQTPPEALVMMPDDTLQTMKAARALKMATDSIRQETESIGLQMAELQKLRQKVAKRHEEIIRKQAALDKGRQELEHQLAMRQSVQAKLGLQQKEEEEKLAQLAKKAEDLQGLIFSITRAEHKGAQLKADERAPQGKKGRLRSFAEAKGHIRTPVAGQVVRMFGVAEGRNETSKGIVIAARDSAQVTAPYDGEVVFTGPFLNYGQLIIIRHSDDFHTLLAGLAKIEVDAGQFLLEGEPIGAMGDSESGNQLYVELRKQNQPVDPAPWINGLNKKD